MSPSNPKETKMTHHRNSALLAATAIVAFAASGFAQDVVAMVDAAVAKAEGQAADSVLSAAFAQKPVAVGKMKLENPTALLTHYGYANDGPIVPAAGDTQTKEHQVEASKTEPDKNTYLVLEGQTGADAAYSYGTHFLFQGHEAGAVIDKHPQGYLTRINLDADEAHRITLMGDKDQSGKTLPFVDGSTWNPFTQTLLLTGEEGEEGGVWQATATYPSKIDDLRGAFGIGSYEGIQLDANGAIWVVEDAGGKGGEKIKNAKQPNSFVYRFTPTDKSDLTKGGKLEALQVMDSANQPVVFHDGKNEDDILSTQQIDVYSYGKTLKTKWVLVHDTAQGGPDLFNANKLAKSALATPFKRPENGVFRPGSNFSEFYFTVTGDTNIDTEAKANHGGFGGILKLAQATADVAEGSMSLVYQGDVAHTGFDNLAFASANDLMIVEDAGDKVHGQRKAFDSGYVIDVTKDYSKGEQSVRFLALGRDASATIDSGLASAKDTGFQNSGDNEITGLYVSDGDATPSGLPGAKVPDLGKPEWRMFYTQQHGDNTTFEVSQKTTN
jgi:hypothetical protein